MPLFVQGVGRAAAKLGVDPLPPLEVEATAVLP
jgi:hypothetical protein